MDSKDSSVNLALAETIDGERAAIRIGSRKLSVERLAAESGVAYGTLRRILAGKLDVNIGDLAALVSVINLYRRTPLTVAEVVEASVARAGGMSKIVEEFGITPLSEVPATTDELADRRRKQEEAAAMTVEELEDVAGAATRDAELDSDEPDLP